MNQENKLITYDLNVYQNCEFLNVQLKYFYSKLFINIIIKKKFVFNNPLELVKIIDKDVVIIYPCMKCWHHISMYENFSLNTLNTIMKILIFTSLTYEKVVTNLDFF